MTLETVAMETTVGGKRGRVVFTGDLTDATVDTKRDQLAEALIWFDSIEVELGNTGLVDNSLVTLMCSAHRVAHSLGKSMVFGSVKTMRQIRELACESGYAESPCRFRACRCLYSDDGTGTARTDEE